MPQTVKRAPAEVRTGGSGRCWQECLGRGCSLLAHQHRLGLPLEVDVWLACDVDGDSLDRAASEAVWALARVVPGHRVADVTADGQALAGDHVASRLELDPALTDLSVAVVERQDAGRHRGRGHPVLL